jgi:hypothetical protein
MKTEAPQPASTPPTRPPARGHRRAPKFLAWLCTIGIVAIAVVVVVHPGSASAPAQLSSQFEMHFDNLSYHIQTGGALSDVTQDGQGRISGSMTVNPPLIGTGRFTGTRGGSTIHFAGAQGGTYVGTLIANGDVSGTYAYPGQHGAWQATPTGPATNTPAWPPWWLWLLLAVAVAGLLVSVGWGFTSTRHARAL